jgi:carboxyl-terminal processing protease
MPARRRTALALLAAVAIAIAAAGALAVAGPSADGPYRRLALFAEALSRIERDYAEPPDRDRLITGAVKGMVRALDPHSALLTPKEYEAFLGEIRGEFCGVGLEVGLRDGVMTVIAPIADSPAERAGIAPGDQIVSIEGTPTAELGLEDAVALIRGRPGEAVRFRLRRPPAIEPFEATIVRAQIKVQSVDATLISPGFAHVRLKQFQNGTAAELRAQLEALAPKGGRLDGVILDLRRNPGGTVDAAVEVADLFLADGAILSIRGRDGAPIQEYAAGRGGAFESVPLAVLIDKGSASAAEIVAGAIQDHGRALVVGTRSFGKGSVQYPFPLRDGYVLKLTIAKYYTPKGRTIQAEGIAPDVAIESRNAPAPDAETALLATLPGERDLAGHLAGERQGGGVGAAPAAAEPTIDDYQLRVAYQIVRGLARAGAATGRARR